MKVITRNWINSNIEIYTRSHKKLVRDDLFSLINFWKQVLLDNGATPNKKIGIAIYFIDDTYLGILFAALELGLQLAILLKPNNVSQTKYPKFNSHFPLDILILNERDWMEDFVLEHLLNNSKKVIDCNDYKNQSSDIDSTGILAKPDSVCLLCNSSGSTGDPKLINHTHNFFYDLCSVNYKSLGFKKKDRVLHLISLNHGSAMGIYFLPSFYIAEKHYLCIEDFSLGKSDGKNWDLWLDFCTKNKITKAQSGYPQQTDGMISAIKRSKKGLPDLTLMVLSFINPEWLSVVKEGKLKKIVSVFGCSETSGPLFLPTVDNKTDFDNFNPKNLGNPIQDFHNIYLSSDGELTVDIPTYGTTIRTQDYLKEENNGYLFQSKKKLYRINDIDINLLDIQNIIAQNFKGNSLTDVLILVDEVYNRLYAVTIDKDILDVVDLLKKKVKDFYSNKVVLHNVYYIKNPEDYITGIKLDREKLLDYIRQKENE